MEEDILVIVFSHMDVLFVLRTASRVSRLWNQASQRLFSPKNKTRLTYAQCKAFFSYLRCTPEREGSVNALARSLYASRREWHSYRYPEISWERSGAEHVETMVRETCVKLAWLDTTFHVEVAINFFMHGGSQVYLTVRGTGCTIKQEFINPGGRCGPTSFKIHLEIGDHAQQVAGERAAQAEYEKSEFLRDGVLLPPQPTRREDAQGFFTYNSTPFITLLLCIKNSSPALIPKDVRRCIWLHCREDAVSWDPLWRAIRCIILPGIPQEGIWDPHPIASSEAAKAKTKKRCLMQ